MKLVDLDALLKFPIRIDHYDKANGNEHFIFGIETVIEYAENLPIVDAVPIIRCKDCDNLTFRTNPFGDAVPCCLDRNMAEIRNLEDFCSYGERKTE